MIPTSLFLPPSSQETDSSSPGSGHSHLPLLTQHSSEPSPLAILQKRLSNPSGGSSDVTPPSSEKPPPSTSLSSKVTTPSGTMGPSSTASPLMALASSLSHTNKPATINLPQQLSSFTPLGGKSDDEDDYD